MMNFSTLFKTPDIKRGNHKLQASRASYEFMTTNPFDKVMAQERNDFENKRYPKR
jgi:hypothetical protein